jgi:4-amino-4-deoxy-L-arabinose transferase-like glycosyltransferase
MFVRWRFVIAGAALLFSLAQINSGLLSAPHWFQFGLLYAGIALVVWGLAAPIHQRISPSFRTLLPLVMLLLLAFFLRTWNLDSGVHVLVDELSPIEEVLALWQQPDLKILRPMGDFSPFPRLFASWQAAGITALGRNLAGLRLPSAFAGTLTVAALYLLGNTLYGRRTALIAALLLATFPPHVHFSRIGLLTSADPLFGTLALAFIARGLKTNQQSDWALGGAALGLTQYFYEGGRLLYPSLVILWLIGRGLHDRIYWRSLRIAALAAVLVAAPVYYTLSTLDASLTTRMSRMGLDSSYWLQFLTEPASGAMFNWFVQHVTQPLALLVVMPEQSPYYAGEQPFILIYLLPAFLLGILWALRTKGGALPLLWLLLTWAGNVLLADSALAPRFVVVFPALALLMALGFSKTITLFRIKRQGALLWVLVIICAIGQMLYYFGPHLASYNRQIRQGMDAEDALFRSAQFPPGTQVLIVTSDPTITEAYAQTLLQFLADGLEVKLLTELTPAALARLSPDRDHAFFIAPGDQHSIDALTGYFDAQPAQSSPYPIPPEQAYLLYYLSS